VLSTLTVLSGNVGCAFTVSITESNSVNPSAYATSAPTGVEALALVAPGITGATVTDSGSGSGNLVGPLPGDVLTVVASGVSGNPAPTASYQWYCNNSPITGAALSTFTVLSGNEGCVITVTITESNGVDPSAHATSAPTGAVNKPPKIDERILRVTSLKGVVGTALTLTSSGGSGTGPVTYRVLDGTATGCSISSGHLSASTAGTCVVTATKAGDATYSSIDSTPSAVSEKAAAPQHAFYIVGNFVTGSSVLTASMQQRLQTIVRTIGSRHFERVSIRGYSSLPGALSSNVTLSQARATSAYVYVTALLRRDGISGVVVTFTGAGLGSSPITLNNQMVTLNCRS
jgi:outer membrane protein OmpA-like peptidoglycan-associated protein